MKKSKVNREAHVPNTKYGTGDFYGQAIKQKVGRIRQDYMGWDGLTDKKMGTPPKSLA